MDVEQNIMINHIKSLYPNLNEYFIKLALEYSNNHSEDDITQLLTPKNLDIEGSVGTMPESDFKCS